ncbi:kinase-like domain-containing protein [Rhizophagus clarus]|uniref:Kinase-like domain-containing protein n=1 Tax=Rhizophagus clarus TaxID=94130 RepID=A0A8H3LV67_9GLOM|nr:kinase-like domain-containing protein [Rhizophagus clarus]
MNQLINLSNDTSLINLLISPSSNISSINLLINSSNNISSINLTLNTLKPKSNYKLKICNECGQKRKFSNEIQHICDLCSRVKLGSLSGNKVVDDFIRYTKTDRKDATWIDGPITWDCKKRHSKELNELKMYYSFRLKTTTSKVNKYYGITQHPVTLNFMIITNYYESGDLSHFIINDFFNITWVDKLIKLYFMISGLERIHDANIIHKDYHSGNIFIDGLLGVTGDLGLSKSSLVDDEDNEIYGIIPYVAPEVLQGHKYTKASDIYSFGMIMWELMTGRRPFWDKSHDMDLIIKKCDGLRPPIKKISKIWSIKSTTTVETKIIKSPDIDPIIANSPGAIYKSRPLSTMTKFVESTRRLKSQSISLKLELELDIDNNIQSSDNNYLTEEINFDIVIPS